MSIRPPSGGSSGGYTPGGTDVAVADGGTGASTAAGARTNLGAVASDKVRSKELRIVDTGNITTTSTSFVAVDSTDLPWQTLTGLEVGDKVECWLSAVCWHGTSGEGTYFDFEVDRPTSANTRTSADVAEGAGRVTAHAATYPQQVQIRDVFTVTEAGTHAFRPMWRTSAGTATMGNAASAGLGENSINFSVRVIPNPQ